MVETGYCSTITLKIQQPHIWREEKGQCLLLLPCTRLQSIECTDVPRQVFYERCDWLYTRDWKSEFHSGSLNLSTTFCSVSVVVSKTWPLWRSLNIVLLSFIWALRSPISSRSVLTAQYNVLSMGLKGGPGSFQRMMGLAMSGLTDVIVFIDDLLLHTKMHQQHHLGLQQVFKRIWNINVKLKRNVYLEPSTSVILDSD